MKFVNKWLISVLLIILGLSAFSQEGPVIRSTCTGSIEASDEGFVIEALAQKEKGFLHVDQLFLKGSDLILALKLPGFSSLPEEKSASYQVKLKFINASGESSRPGAGELSGAAISHFRGEKGLNITWLEFVESDFFLLGPFQLQIEIVISNVAESLYIQPPQFSSTSKWASGLAMGGGLAMMGTGYLVRQSSEDDYEIYKRMVFEEDPQASSQLSQSNNKKVSSDFLLIGGGAALAAGGLYFALKYLPYRQKRKVYNKYQNMLSFEVQPAWEWMASGSGTSGLRFILHF